MYQEKERKSEKGITLIALIITIIVLLILAGVSISMVVGENGILNRATDAKRKSDQATTKENIEMAVIGALTEESYYMDVSKESLERELAKSFDMSKINMIDNLDGTFTIEFIDEKKTYLVSGKKVEEIDWEKSFENAKAPAEQTTTPENIIGIGTDGNPVNMDLWEYYYDEVTNGYLLNDQEVGENTEYKSNGTGTTTVRNSGYKGTFTDKGEIIGFVPQYISVDKGKNFKPVTSLYYSFYEVTGLKIQPKLPSTVINMSGTFSFCSNMKTSSLPSKVQRINWCYRESGIVEAPSIPESVTSMIGCFCSSDIERVNIKIPEEVKDITQLFSECHNLREAIIDLPTSLESMDQTFAYCKILENLSLTIPEKVKNLSATFYDCFKLSGKIKIKSIPEQYKDCFCSVNELTSKELILIVDSEELRSSWEELLSNGGANVDIEIQVER